MAATHPHAGNIGPCNRHSNFKEDAEVTADLVVTHIKERGCIYLASGRLLHGADQSLYERIGSMPLNH